LDRTEPLLNGFKLIRRDGFLRLGTDAVLLSAFVRADAGTHVCDLGCGAGAVSLLLAARHANIEIDGVELQPGAAALFAENIRLNGAEDRLRSICCDLRKYKRPDGVPYAVIVCNPPYNRIGSGKPAALSSARIERSGEAAELEDFTAAAARLGDTGSRFFAVMRADRTGELLCAMRGAGIEPKRLLPVYARAGRQALLILAEGRRGGRPGLIFEPALYLYDENGEETERLKAVYAGENL